MKKLPHRSQLVICILLISTLALIPSQIQALGKTSVGLVGGFGPPVGWWADRWDMMQMGELNLRYELSSDVFDMDLRGGVVLITGLGKTYFGTMSKEEVAAESRYSDVNPDFQDYTTIVTANQGGSFKQLPIGFGFYLEKMIGRVRPYGSLAMMVYNWRFERSQEFLQVIEIPDPDFPVLEHNDDDWRVERDGSDLGAQLTLGAVYSINRLIHIDLSAAYYLVNISKKYNSIAYWGQHAVIPAGDPDNDLVEDSKGSVDFMQIRLGLRIGG